jgi:hypothetical protein
LFFFITSYPAFPSLIFYSLLLFYFLFLYLLFPWREGRRFHSYLWSLYSFLFPIIHTDFLFYFNF